jgi:hypothetical protein
MAKVRMRLTVEIPDDVDSLKRMIRYLDMATEKIDDTVQERIKPYQETIWVLEQMIEAGISDEKVLLRREQHLKVITTNLEGAGYAGNLTWTILERLIDIQKQRIGEKDATES